MYHDGEVPFEVLDEFPETGDLSDQQGGDVIEKASKVRFSIAKVEPRINKKDGVIDTAKLNVRAVVGPLGVDGEGRYKGKNFFIELLTYVNPQIRTGEWWEKQARFPYKQFLKALGYDSSKPPKVTDAFLAELTTKEFIADIVKSAVKEDSGEVNANGKKIYTATGEFKNEIKNFRSVEIAE